MTEKFRQNLAVAFLEAAGLDASLKEKTDNLFCFREFHARVADARKRAPSFQK